jgi:dipeptidase D
MENLEPKEVFKYFKEISNIPRCSLKEKQISDYLVSFAKKRGLEVYQDEILNVIIKKKATKGYENAPTLIVQGHMDMVCEKNQTTIHNFEKDPIKLIVDGDTLKADGTTLGADNGIAVAFCLALLDSTNIPHPPLEILLTSQEEIGLIGASKLDGSKLKGKFLINIDAEDEGILFTSCAGGGRVIVELPISWSKPSKNYKAYKINISGLKGGHSGIDIDKSRANSNKLLGRVLNSILSDIEIASINGGLKTNAIPREAQAVILINEEKKENVFSKVEKWGKTFKNEFQISDPEIKVSINSINENIEKVFDETTKTKVNQLFILMPYGINTMSAAISGLVESSSNLGIVEIDNDIIRFSNATRSSVGSLKEEIFNQIMTLGKIVGANVKLEGVYPEWEYKKDSILRDKFVSVFEKLYNKTPQITALHAGLECGILSDILGKDVDMIAFGPDIDDVHTPDEKLSVSSTKRNWEYLCEVLKEFK